MKKKLKTPKLRLAEAKRLAVALHRLQWDISELISASGDYWHDDEPANVALSNAERLFGAVVGRLVATEGLRFGEWMDRASGKQKKKSNRV